MLVMVIRKRRVIQSRCHSDMTENPSRIFCPILDIRALFWILLSLAFMAIKESESLYFPKSEYMVRISESTSRGKIISQIRAFDSFNISCETSSVLYSIEAINDIHSGLVGINETSGEVKLLLDNTDVKIKGVVRFHLKAHCQNQSLMADPALALFKIFQDDIQQDKERACWTDSDYVFSLQENSKEVLIYTFQQSERAEYRISRVYDEDDDKHTYITQHFTVDNEKQQLLLRQALDREEADHLILNISCRIKPEDESHTTSSQLFTIYVDDVDDNPPVFYETETQFMELNVTNGELPLKLPLITDRDQNFTDLNTYKITITEGVNIVQVKEIRQFLRHPLGREGQQRDKPKVTTILLKLSQSAKLSSLPFSSFDVNLTDTKYKSEDKLYTPTATLRFRVGTAAVVTTDAPKPKALVAHVYRNASKYTKVLTLSDNKSIRHGEYRMIGTSDIMAITAKTGIIFVNSPSKLSINKSEIHLIVKTPQRVNQLVTIKIRGSVNTEKKNCDYGCAELHKEECESGCGYGTPMASCNWRKGSLGLTASYATCRPDAHTCPDGFCDELEEQNQHICPQDCVRATIIGEGFINTVKGGIKEAKSPCWCQGDFNVVCNCGLEIPLPATTSNSSFTISTEKQRVIMKTSPFKEDSEEKGCDESCRTSVAATVSCALALLLLVLIATFFWKRYKKQSRTLKHVGSILSMTAMPSDYIDDIERRVSHSSPQWPPSPKSRDEEVDANWEFPRANLILEDTLGEGEFGQVVRGQAYGLNEDDCYTTVAVKMLKPDASGTEYQDLISELNLLKEVKHPNVIRLLGACTQKGPHYVIVEFCEFGSLKNYLRKCKYRGRRSWEDKQNQHDGSYQNETDEILTTRDLMSFAWQTTRGMEYLSRMKLVHRDLAARNILVATGKQLKISDFGLSRDVYEADTYLKMSKGRIPVKWMAPESLYAQIYTTKSDIWSFGVVLWEIVTLGANPYPGIPPERLFNLLKTGYRMDRPDDCPDELYAIMQKCWKSEPEERPTFTALTYIIDRMLQDKVGYLELQGDSDYLEDKTSVSGSVEKKLLWQDSGDGYGNITVVKSDESFYPPSDDEISDNNMAKFGRDEENESRKLLLRTNNGVQKDLTALNSSVSNIYSV